MIPLILTSSISSKNTLSALSNGTLHTQLLSAWMKETKEWSGVQIPHPDIFFVSESSQAPSIAQIRLFSQELRYPPHQLPQKLFVIWKLDDTSVPAQNALLKDLEEPPSYAHIVITTTTTGRILPTILSRTNQKEIKLNSLKQTEENEENNEENLAGDLVTAKIAGKTNIQQFSQPSFWTQKSYAQLIALAAEYSQREVALTLVLTLISTILEHPTYPNPQHRNMLELLQDTYLALQANGNVSLTLETCFFRLHTVQNMV